MEHITAQNIKKLKYMHGLMACSADINVSQGSLGTYARCGGIINIHLTTYLPRNLPVKVIFNIG